MAIQDYDSTNSDLRNPRLEALAVFCLCAAFVALSMSFQRSACATSDENIYLPAGYTYLKWHDYRINTEHPPLIKMLAALPLLSGDVWPTDPEPGPEDLSDSDYVTSERLLRLSWAIAVEYPNSE